jgi:phosphate transport system permease protein
MASTVSKIYTTAIHTTSRTTTRRRLFDCLGWSASALAFLLLGAAMVWILVMVFIYGYHSLTPKVITQVTEGTGGGLLNAIEGTLVLALGGVLLAVPLGLGAGIYLAEFDYGPLAPVVRFLADVLAGVPSIVIGYFGYVTLVTTLGWEFSAAAGSVALAVISVPYICRTTEMVLRGVARGAYALGATDRQVVLGITVPAALPGIVTGILLALAISVGETAPLLYMAGWSSFLWNGHLIKEPIGYLPYVSWAFVTEPFASAQALAYAAALFVTLFVLVISVEAGAIFLAD